MFVTARKDNNRWFLADPWGHAFVLRDLDIAVARLDATEWGPDQKDMSQSRQDRAQAMREAHEAAAYTRWVAAELQASIDDPRPSIPHEEVMAEMDADLAAWPSA